MAQHSNPQNRLEVFHTRRISALSELGPDETRLRRQRAHDVASVLGSLHIDGLDVDAQEAFVIAQRYVDGEISLDKMAAAIMALSTDGASVVARRPRSNSSANPVLSR
jgi:hypothetical protein